MFEHALTLRKASAGQKIALKTLVSAAFIALAVLLPQVVHMALGQPGGVQWLPMYLPILIGGCLLGTRWALVVGTLSPVVSFLLTSLWGEPMPAAARLPFMAAELAVFAVVSGLFSKQIAKDALWAFPAVLAAQFAGRAVFLGLVAAFQAWTALTPALVWTQIKTGLPGLLVQAAIAPLAVITIRALLLREKKYD